MHSLQSNSKSSSKTSRKHKSRKPDRDGSDRQIRRRSEEKEEASRVYNHKTEQVTQARLDKTTVNLKRKPDEEQNENNVADTSPRSSSDIASQIQQDDQSLRRPSQGSISEDIQATPSNLPLQQRKVTYDREDYEENDKEPDVSYRTEFTGQKPYSITDHYLHSDNYVSQYPLRRSNGIIQPQDHVLEVNGSYGVDEEQAHQLPSRNSAYDLSDMEVQKQPYQRVSKGATNISTKQTQDASPFPSQVHDECNAGLSKEEKNRSPQMAHPQESRNLSSRKLDLGTRVSTSYDSSVGDNFQDYPVLEGKRWATENKMVYEGHYRQPTASTSHQHPLDTMEQVEYGKQSSLGSLSSSIVPDAPERKSIYREQPEDDSESQEDEVPSPLEEVVETSEISETEHIESADTYVFVRWITPEIALKKSCLQDIPVDLDPISSRSTFAEFKSIASEKISNLSGTALGPKVNVELFSMACHLSCQHPESSSLEELELKGSLEAPLDIFAVVCRESELMCMKPQERFGFYSSPRGIATFLTSLQMFLQEIKIHTSRIDDILETLWEVSHFPPALLTLREMCETGVTPEPCSIFAACFRVIVNKILSDPSVPYPVRSQPDLFLESSHTVFAWLYQAKPESLQARNKREKCVRRVQLQQIEPETQYMPSCYFKNNTIISIPDFSWVEDDLPSDLEDVEPYQCKILVSKEKTDDIGPRELALALQNRFGVELNFYFERRETMSHRRVSCVRFQDLSRILHTVVALNIINPTKLSHHKTPFMTLDRNGYVSICEKRRTTTDDIYYILSNGVTEKDTIRSSDPGPYLMESLRVVQQSKIIVNWEIEIWREVTYLREREKSQEAIIICVDKSGSMGFPMSDAWAVQTDPAANVNDLVRLTEVKEVFQNLVERFIAYKIRVHLGLVTFSNRSSIYVDKPLTNLLYDFGDSLMNIEANGSTAIWDAVIKAKMELVNFRNGHPQTKLRIIALTDGEDNDSLWNYAQVCHELYRENIVFDAIVIGTEASEVLSRIAKIADNTGGYAFHPQTRNELFQISLLDPFIDINKRPDLRSAQLPTSLDYAPYKIEDMSDPSNVPPCRLPSQLFENFVRLERSVLKGSSTFVVNRHDRATAGSTSVLKRYQKEVKEILAHKHGYMDVYVSESNMGFWRVAMKGPPQSPYAYGTFSLFIDLGVDFPRKPPILQFTTPILHPNISTHGRVCHEILDFGWTPNTHVYQVLRAIWSMLLHPEPRDAINPLLAMEALTDRETVNYEIEQQTAQYAGVSRSELKKEFTTKPGESPEFTRCSNCTVCDSCGKRSRWTRCSDCTPCWNCDSSREHGK